MLCFRRDGTPAWRISELPGTDGDSLPQIGSLAVDSDSGLIYLADQMGRRIVKLLDVAYARHYGLAGEVEAAILELNQESLEGGTDALRQKAAHHGLSEGLPFGAMSAPRRQ